MSNAYSVDDLLGFLDHAADKGLMPPASATALAVACRNVFGILTDQERANIAGLDRKALIRRFQNKRAKDFTPDTLKEYGRRVERAVTLFEQWRDDPANFQVPTRATAVRRKNGPAPGPTPETEIAPTASPALPSLPGTYQTAVPLGPDRIITLVNVPVDLTEQEALRVAAFVKMLAVPK